MGRGLAAAHREARDALAEADAVLGLPLTRLMFDGPADELTRTENAQPALLAHGVAAARVLAARGVEPGVAAGHSLGEFTALVAAGALAYADGLRLVRLRGELMGRAGEERRGAMSAVLGLDDEAAEAICAEASGGDGIVVPANLNAPGQVVISGDAAAVARAGELARGRGAKRVVPLQVSGAFHSPLVAPAAAGLRAALAGTPLERPRVPVVANVTAEPVEDPAELRRLLAEQLTSPVRWAASMTRMVRMGFTDFVECGPGRVLAGLARRVEGVRSAVSVGDAADLESGRAGIAGAGS
jgi:[acyl-carrier-protein] S-malonyltransferase